MDIKDLYPQRYYDLKREYRNSMQPMKRLGPKKTPAVGAAVGDKSPKPKRKSKTAQKKTSRSISPSVSGSSSGTPNKISRTVTGTDEKKNDSNASVLSQLNKSSSFGSLSDQEIALSFFSKANQPTATSANIPPPPPESPLLSSLENNNAKFNRLVSKNPPFEFS